MFLQFLPFSKKLKLLFDLKALVYNVTDLRLAGQVPILIFDLPFPRAENGKVVKKFQEMRN